MLTAEEKRALDDAAAALYYISTDDNRIHHIDLYADYSDTNEGLLQLAYNHRMDNREQTRPDEGEGAGIIDVLKAQINHWYDNTIYQMTDDIIKRAGFALAADNTEMLRDYLWENYSFSTPYDHYLNQNMHINLLLDGGREVNRDFIAIHELNEAMIGGIEPEYIADVLSEKTALHWLVEQQGYTMSDLQKTMADYIDYFYTREENKDLSHGSRLTAFHKTHSIFLTSVCEELSNMTNYMNTLTVLADVNMYEYCQLMTPGTELVLPKNTMLGIFSPWLGGGSTLDITLEKELVLPSELIWDVQVEDANLQNQYSVNSVYGLVSRCWVQPAAVRDAETPQKVKPALKNMIQDANDRKDKSAPGNHKETPEPER